MKTLLLNSVLLTSISIATAAASDTVVVVASGHPVAAKDQSITYSGECPRGKYEMRISGERKQVQFILGETRIPLDVSDTVFGQTFLAKPLAGTFSFTCLDGTLQANFWGVQVPPTGASKPVAYLYEIGFDGSIKKDHGMVEMEQSRVVNVLTRARLRGEPALRD